MQGFTCVPALMIRQVILILSAGCYCNLLPVTTNRITLPATLLCLARDFLSHIPIAYDGVTPPPCKFIVMERYMYRASLLFSAVLQPVLLMHRITCRVSWLLLVLVLFVVLPCFICSTTGLIRPLATKAPYLLYYYTPCLLYSLLKGLNRVFRY